MKPELKKRWVKALRSKKYKQGQEYLRSCDNAYCCLGVLCDISGVRWKEHDYAFGVGSHGVTGSPTPAINKRLGLPESVVGELIRLNDDELWSFRRIATWIEKNL